MSVVESFVPTAVQVTPEAVAKIRDLVDEEGNADLKLRVFVTGGGCSGFQYGFSFDEKTAEDDTLVETQGARVVVDALSIQYLQGSVVNYEEGLQGSRFTITNPNAKTTCGCGASFSL